MTLFDTSVIIDARDAQSPWPQWAKEKIAECCSTDGAGINAVMVAEASVRVEQREHFARHLEQTGMTLLPLPVSAALPAARAYALYLDRLKADGKTPVSKTPLGDFFHRRSCGSGKAAVGDARHRAGENLLSKSPVNHARLTMWLRS